MRWDAGAHSGLILPDQLVSGMSDCYSLCLCLERSILSCAFMMHEAGVCRKIHSVEQRWLPDQARSLPYRFFLDLPQQTCFSCSDRQSDFHPTP